MITWTPTVKDYNAKLRRLEQNADFAKNDDNVWFRGITDPWVPQYSMDDFNAHFQRDNGGAFAPTSEIMSKVKNRPNSEADQAAYRWRDRMGSEGIDLSHGVTTTKVYTDGDPKLPITVYTPQMSDPDEELGAIVAYHGGGWIGGNVLVNQNFCRYMAEQAHMRVFNVDFRLAPEYPAMAGFDDCYAALNWIVDNAGDLHVDLNTVAVYGDSAGGTTAAAVAYQDRKDGHNYVTHQFMAYPCLTLDHDVAEKIDWPASKYHFNSVTKERYDNDQLFVGKGMDTLRQVYVGSQNVDDPRISPIEIPDDIMAKMPQALIAIDEFDPLRPQGYLYAKNLAKAGVNSHSMCYYGMSHAFLDKFGIFAQGQHFADTAATWLHQGLTGQTK
ncbi:alpha/beta hydrolase [Levilactobacillus bambusae]|nr:alpha/beta hydrolase [Levilactobacillus bambusae]